MRLCYWMIAIGLWSLFTYSRKAEGASTSSNRMCGDYFFLRDDARGGTEARPNQWRWVAAIFITPNSSEPNFKSVDCGGVLVTKRHVLSAAHCFCDNRTFKRIPAESVIIRLGEYDIWRDDDGASPQSFRVSRITLHGDFNQITRYNDIALLEMEQAVEFSKSIFPVCLSSDPRLQMELRDLKEREGVIVGWGASSNGILQYAVVPFLEQDDCRDEFSDRVNISIINKQLCAGNDFFPYTCLGDTGGPIVISLVEGAVVRFYLVGIASILGSCDEPYLPGIYTRVTEYIDWIYRLI